MGQELRTGLLGISGSGAHEVAAKLWPGLWSFEGLIEDLLPTLLTRLLAEGLSFSPHGPLHRTFELSHDRNWLSLSERKSNWETVVPFMS